jgi:D-galactose 1-dehydrogenase
VAAGRLWRLRSGHERAVDPDKAHSRAHFPARRAPVRAGKLRRPIAADLDLTTESGLEICAALDFREMGPQRWNIDLETDAGAMQLSAGGGLLRLGDQPVPPDAGSLDAEYEAIYRRSGELVPRGDSDVDARPLQLVSDIFLVAQQIPVESFEDPLPG